MNEHEESKGETGWFFSLDLAQVDAMVHGGAGVRDLLAYVVLCRGVNRRGTSAISTHGAHSISARTGSLPRCSKGPLVAVTETEAQKLDEVAPRRRVGRVRNRPGKSVHADLSARFAEQLFCRCLFEREG